MSPSYHIFIPSGDEEVIHEQLAADIDGDDRRRMLKIRHRLGRGRVEVRRRPDLRQHDAIAETLALVLAPRLENYRLRPKS